MSASLRALVTGGAGFIGSHLVRHLQGEGAAVAALDDLSMGRRENIPEGVPLTTEELSPFTKPE